MDSTNFNTAAVTMARMESLRGLFATRSHKQIFDSTTASVAMVHLESLLGRFTARSRQQVMFHTTLMHASLRFVFGDEYVDNEVWIKQKYHAQEPKRSALVCCPQRLGKSKALGMFVAAALLAVPNIKVLLFSPGRRQSSELMKIVYGEIKYLADSGWEYKTLVNNGPDLVIEVDGNQRSLKGLPNRSGVPLDVAGALIICNDVAFMDIAVVDAVLSRARAEKTGLIAVSAVSEPFYSVMQQFQASDKSGVFPDMLKSSREEVEMLKSLRKEPRIPTSLCEDLSTLKL